MRVTLCRHCGSPGHDTTSTEPSEWCDKERLQAKRQAGIDATVLQAWRAGHAKGGEERERQIVDWLREVNLHAIAADLERGAYLSTPLGKIDLGREPRSPADVFRNPPKYEPEPAKVERKNNRKARPGECVPCGGMGGYLENGVDYPCSVCGGSGNEPTREDETAWVIECRDLPLCLGRACKGAGLSWVTFTDDQAMKFDTKDEAETFIREHCLTDLASATEHMWCSVKEKP